MSHGVTQSSVQVEDLLTRMGDLKLEDTVTVTVAFAVFLTKSHYGI